MSKQTDFQKRMGIHGEDDHGVWIRSTRTLRQTIGILGMALPMLLLIFSPDCKSQPIDSISHYYYTRSADFLIVILTLVGVFLILYTKDFVLSTVAGIAAICVVFFPTSRLEDHCRIVDIDPNGLREGFHYFSAVVFLAILMFMTFFHFTKPDAEEIEMNRTKVDYKWLYQLCGALMLIALLIIGVRLLGIEAYNEWYDRNKLTFWMEVLALEAFGLAWLVKGAKTFRASDYRSYLETHKK